MLEPVRSGEQENLATETTTMMFYVLIVIGTALLIIGVFVHLLDNAPEGYGNDDNFQL